MDFNRYHEWLAQSDHNVLENDKIVEGNTVEYFNIPNDPPVLVEEVNHDKGIVVFSYKVNREKRIWWDYFMDANCMVK